MRYLGEFILRTIMILIGLLLAVFAAGLFLSFGLHQNAGLTMEEREFIMPWTLPAGGLFLGIVAGSAAFLPAIIAIAVAELGRFSGLLMNLGLGALVAVFAGYREFGFQPVESSAQPADVSSGTLIILLSAGFIGGFVYWLIAGRSAGKWLDVRRDSNDTH